MSYILNALRKAEKEHQAKSHSSWLNDGQHEQSSRNKHFVLWIVGALILINLITLSFIFLSNKKNETVEKNEPVVEAIKMNDTAGQKKLQLSPLEIDLESEQEKPLSKAPSDTEKPLEKSFAEYLSAENGVKATLTEGSAKKKIQTSEDIRPDKQDNVEYKAEESKNIKTEPLPSKSISPGQSEIIEATKVAENTKAGVVYIPTIKELSRNFRRTVPEMNINVYVYSEDDRERFVIIDMVKYTSGSTLPKNMHLKEIRNDSLVVEYRGKTFRIMRP